jgi:hypothetical protein
VGPVTTYPPDPADPVGFVVDFGRWPSGADRRADASGTRPKEDPVAAPKTKPTPTSVDDFVKAIDDPKRREDCLALIALMKKITKSEPKMWGSSIVGFGDHHYRYESGREGDTFVLGFSPRKDALTLYMGPGLERFQETLDQLGKYKTGKGCLYIRRLEDVDESILSKLLKQAATNLLNAAG